MAIALTRTIPQVRFATIHHSGSAGIPVNMEQLKRRLATWNERHRKRSYPSTKGEFGYKYLLYSFAVAGDGQWVQTQHLKYKMYHATDWYKGAESANQWGFGILLEGNFEVEQPTNQQLEAAAQIIYKFNTENNTRLIVKGHGEFSAPRHATLCPGKFMGLSTDLASKLSWIIRRASQLHGDGQGAPAELYASAIDTLNVRSGPGTNFPKMGQLTIGQKVRVVDSNVNGQVVDGVGAWCKFQFNGVEGFAHSNWMIAVAND